MKEKYASSLEQLAGLDVQRNIHDVDDAYSEPFIQNLKFTEKADKIFNDGQLRSIADKLCADDRPLRFETEERDIASSCSSWCTTRIFLFYIREGKQKKITLYDGKSHISRIKEKNNSFL